MNERLKMPTSFIHLLILTSLGIAIAAAQSRPPQTPPQGQPPQRPAKRGWSFWLSSEEPDYRSFAPVTYSQQLHDGGTINSSRDLLVQYGYVDTPESKNSLISDLLPLGFLLEPGPVQAFSPSDGKALQLRCPNGTCSTESQCGPFYRCLFGQLPTREGGLDWTVDLSDTLPGCLEGAYLATQKRQEQRPGDQGSAPGASIPQWGLQCPLTLVNITSSDQRPCSDDGLFERSLDNWQVQTRTDENIQIFLRGGVDLSGVWWPGKGSGTVTQELGRQMGKNDFDCSLTLPCQPSSDLDCAAIGLRQAPWKEVIRCKWGLFALTAIENISQHLTSSYAALDAINVTAILDGFKIDDFRPKGGTKFTNLDFLRGLGNVFAVAAGFAPAALPRTTPNNLILPGQGAFLSAVSASLSQNNAGSGATDVSQDDFNSEVEKVYDQLKGALDGIVKILFSGEALNGVSLTDMLRDGAWVNATTIPNVGDISQQLRIEILSRAINDLWKIFSSNKRWVLFVDLQDDPANQAKCIADNTGPQDLKYCGDGGVYYSYNYVETGDHDGHTDYPWGAEKLQNLGIDMRVSHLHISSQCCFLSLSTFLIFPSDSLI